MSIQRWTNFFHFLTVATLLVGTVVLSQDPVPPPASKPAGVSAPASKTTVKSHSVAVPAPAAWQSAATRAIQTNNASWCQQLADKNDSYFCILQLAGAKKDKNWCNLIPEVATDPSQELFWNRSACLSQVAECLKPGVDCSH